MNLGRRSDKGEIVNDKSCLPFQQESLSLAQRTIDIGKTRTSYESGNIGAKIGERCVDQERIGECLKSLGVWGEVVDRKHHQDSNDRYRRGDALCGHTGPDLAGGEGRHANYSCAIVFGQVIRSFEGCFMIQGALKARGCKSEQLGEDVQVRACCG